MRLGAGAPDAQNVGVDPIRSNDLEKVQKNREQLCRESVNAESDTNVSSERREMNTQMNAVCEISVAKTVAGDDLRCGDFVCALNETVEYPSFFWCSDSHVVAPNEPVRVRWRGSEGGIPLKVKAICLPFVFVKSPWRKHEVLDVRQCDLVRLSPKYARPVWKRLKKQKRPRRH